MSERRKYDPEFREGAVTIVRETGKSIAEVARELGIGAGTLGSWVKKDRLARGENADRARLDPAAAREGCQPAPPAISQSFAATLNAGTRPFHFVNYLSVIPGGMVLGNRAMERLMDSTIEHLRDGLTRESEGALGLAMHFPVGWDPYFKGVMNVADVYHYASQHYDHHRRQLTTRRALDVRDR